MTINPDELYYFVNNKDKVNNPLPQGLFLTPAELSQFLHQRCILLESLREREPFIWENDIFRVYCPIRTPEQFADILLTTDVKLIDCIRRRLNLPMDCPYAKIIKILRSDFLTKVCLAHAKTVAI